MEKIRTLISELVLSRQKILSLIEPIEEEMFFKKKSNNSWSLAQVIKHLTLVNQGILARIKDSKNYPPQKIGLLKKLLPFDILIPLRFMKIKAPSFVDPIDLEGKNKEKIISEYKTSHENLVKYCEENLEEIKDLTPKHPILGMLSFTGILRFLLGHERRHEKQIRELV